MPYPNPYGGLSTGITSAGSSIAEALRKLEEQKRQDEWMQMLRSFMGGGQGTPPAVTDWGSNVTSPGQTAGTLPPPQNYGAGQYGSPVDWSKWVTDEPANWGSNMTQGTGADAGGGSNKGGGNKSGG